MCVCVCVCMGGGGEGAHTHPIAPTHPTSYASAYPLGH